MGTMYRNRNWMDVRHDRVKMRLLGDVKLQIVGSKSWYSKHAVPHADFSSVDGGVCSTAIQVKFYASLLCFWITTDKFKLYVSICWNYYTNTALTMTNIWILSPQTRLEMFPALLKYMRLYRAYRCCSEHLDCSRLLSSLIHSLVKK